VFYKTMMCRFHLNNRCSRGADCQFAHSPEVLRVAPDLTCTKMCPAIIRKGRCEVPSCRFAHSRSELRYLRMPESEGDDGSILQLEHTLGMKRWDQPPAVNLPQVPPRPGTKAHRVVSVQGTLPREASRAACREMSLVGSGEAEARCSSQEEYNDVQGPFLPAQSSPHLSADPFMALNGGQRAALLPFGSCKSPLADDENLRIREEPRLAAMQQWQHMNACAQAPHGPAIAGLKDHDACEGSVQNFFLARLSL